MAIDEKTKKLARLVVNYSLKVKHDENVIISSSTEAEPFIVALYEEILKAGAHPILKLTVPGLDALYYKHAKSHHLDKFPDNFDYLVKNAQVFISINAPSNVKELSNADPDKIALQRKIVRPIHDYLHKNPDKIRWMLVDYPTIAKAQEAGMSMQEYEKFSFDACLQDWQKLGKKIDEILKIFRKAKNVAIKGEGVDLSMQIRGDKAIADKGGECNMPAGEIFMAPIRKSVNGWIKFDYPSIRNGNEVDGIYIEFVDGKAITIKAKKNERFLRSMLSIDENASYVGEIGIGLNPKIKKVTNNLSFDEKIIGTIHLAFGSAIEENGGGNDSALHWDIVKDMKKGEIILDGKVVQKNGKWIV